jgi:hypothetical protein
VSKELNVGKDMGEIGKPQINQGYTSLTQDFMISRLYWAK